MSSNNDVSIFSHDHWGYEDHMRMREVDIGKAVIVKCIFVNVSHAISVY